MSKLDVSDKVVIVGAVRTPIGAVNGALAPLQAEPLATRAVKGVLEQTGSKLRLQNDGLELARNRVANRVTSCAILATTSTKTDPHRLR